MQAGVDTHRDTLAVAVLNGLGRPVDVRELPNTNGGFKDLATMLEQHGVERIGIEGSGNYGRALATHLALNSAELQVVEVPPGQTFRERSGRMGAGKTDPGDAVAIARITAREEGLPRVRLTVGPAGDLRALLDYREQLIGVRTRASNRINVELSGLRPGFQQRIPSLRSPSHRQAVRRLLRGDQSVRADLIRRRLDRMKRIDVEVADVTSLIEHRVAASQTHLLSLYGVGSIVAGRILAEVVDVRRYRSRHAFAAANGTAPIPASSGQTVRVRLNRGGNRQLNRMLYVIALSQIRTETPGRDYYRRKRSEGKTRAEAMRCLKRRLSDVVYRLLIADIHDAHQLA
jgi:transposase